MTSPPPQVALAELNADNVRAYCALAVAPEQQRFVAPVAVSLAQALFAPEAWYRGITADGEPAGFVMLALHPERPEYFLWRFLVDRRFQGRGVGAAALRLVVAHVRGLGAREFLTSYVPGEGCPGPFYEKYGFRATGALEEDEIVLALALA
jgi:diamine N-acetyltransferase